MFNEKKMLQIISYLLSLHNNEMEKLKLIEELYLIDRASIDENNTSVSGDEFFSLKYGPVLSNTLNIINDIPNGNSWAEYLSIYNNKKIRLIKPFDEGRLSKKDKYFIQLISDKYKNYTTSQLIEYTHTLPEWKRLKATNTKIRFANIMKALGKFDEEIAYVKEEYNSLSELYTSLGLA